MKTIYIDHLGTQNKKLAHSPWKTFDDLALAHRNQSYQIISQINIAKYDIQILTQGRFIICCIVFRFFEGIIILLYKMNVNVEFYKNPALKLL